MKRYQIINIVNAILIQILTTVETKSQKIHRNSCHKEATFKANGTNFMIKADSAKLISTTSAPSLAHCTRSCIKRDGCKSMVYKKKALITNENNCQILNAEKGELTSNDMGTSTGWKYYDTLKQVYRFNYDVKERGNQVEVK